MTRQQNHDGLYLRMSVIFLLGAALVGCSSEVSFSPTAPKFPDMQRTVGALQTLDIEGSLETDQGFCDKATILVNGKEVEGARSVCLDSRGCTGLELAGRVSVPAGHHTITFKVLRQSAEAADYLAAGVVRVSQENIDSLQPLTLSLRPTRARLARGEGVTFEIDLWD